MKIKTEVKDGNNMKGRDLQRYMQRFVEIKQILYGMSKTILISTQKSLFTFSALWLSFSLTCTLYIFFPLSLSPLSLYLGHCWVKPIRRFTTQLKHPWKTDKNERRFTHTRSSMRTCRNPNGCHSDFRKTRPSLVLFFMPCHPFCQKSFEFSAALLSLMRTRVIPGKCYTNFCSACLCCVNPDGKEKKPRPPSAKLHISVPTGLFPPKHSQARWDI